MYQVVQRTCRAIVFAHSTYRFAALSLPSPSSLLKLPNRVCARRPCWRTKTIEDICIKIQYISIVNGKSLDCFGPPTWPSGKHSITPFLQASTLPPKNLKEYPEGFLFG